MANELNGYELSRKWFDWCFENPDKISPNHTALYFFIIEHCNRLGWKKKFGLPTTMAKESIGIRSYNTYINTLNDLVSWGAIVLIEKSKNQYSSNIIAISNFDKALVKALDKAFIKHDTKHTTKQVESTSESIDSIDKQLTINNKPLNKEPIKQYREFAHLKLSFEDFEKLQTEYSKIQIDEILDKIENYKKNTNYKNLYLTANIWLKKENKNGTTPTNTIIRKSVDDKRNEVIDLASQAFNRLANLSSENNQASNSIQN